MTHSMEAPVPEPMSSPAGTLELVRRAASDGAADAKAAAERAWTATEMFVCRFTYTTCYTISYGVVFPAMLLSRAVPKDNAAVRGLMDGAAAAIQKVDSMRSLGEASEPAAAPSAG